MTDTQSQLHFGVLTNKGGDIGMTTERHECSECEKTFTKRIKLTIHNATVHRNERLHDCPHCPERFRLRFHLVLHQRRIHPLLKLPRSKGAIRKDLFSRKWKRRRLSLLCSYCGRFFCGRQLLEWHRQTVHRQRELHHCLDRRKRLLRRNGVQRHKNVICPNDKSLKVRSIEDVSQNNLNVASDVERIVGKMGKTILQDLEHRSAMVASTQHSTPLCNNDFKEDGTPCFLKKEAGHNSESETSADVSFNIFGRIEASLRKVDYPQQIPNTKGKYSCTKCDLVLKSKKNLQRHSAIVHGLGRFYMCPHCCRRIRCISELQCHVKRTHRKEMTPEESRQLVPVVTENNKPVSTPTIVMCESVSQESPCFNKSTQQQKMTPLKGSEIDQSKESADFERKTDKSKKRHANGKQGLLGVRKAKRKLELRAQSIPMLPDSVRFPAWVNDVKPQESSSATKYNWRACKLRGSMYECPECKKRLKTERTLRRHMAVLHGRGKYHQCDHCNRRFRGPYELQNHVVSAHCEQKPVQKSSQTSPQYPCVLCSKRFHDRRVVNVHRQIAHCVEGIATGKICTDSSVLSMVPFFPRGATGYRPHYSYPWVPSFYFRPTSEFRASRFAMSESILRKMARAPLKRKSFIRGCQSMRVDNLAWKLSARQEILDCSD